jgi:hypothetical protein
MYDKPQPYFGSSTYLKKDTNESGLWNFSKDIIGIYPFIDKKELLDRETKYVKQFDTLNPKGYNRCLPNNQNKICRTGDKASEETKLLQSINGKGKHSGKRSQEVKDKISFSLTGKKQSEESRKARAKSHIGLHWKVSDEGRKNKSIAHLGIKASEEHKKNTSIAITEWWRLRKNNLIKCL